MHITLIKDFVYEVALLLALSVIYESAYLIHYRLKKVYQKTFITLHSGVFVGAIGICLMSVPLQLTPGIILDARSVLIGVTALTFGLGPTLVASGMMIIYRIILGGVGMWAGIGVIVSAAAVGLIWRKYIKPTNNLNQMLSMYFMGVVIHAFMLVSMLLLPKPMIPGVLADITAPVMLIFPLATELLGMLLRSQQKRNQAVARITEAEERYRSLFDHSQAIMFMVGLDGRILDANLAACEFYGWPAKTMKTMTLFDINTLPEDKVRLVIKKAVSEQKNHYLFHHKRANGAVVAVEVYTSPITFNGETVLYSIVHDISQRVAAHRALEESEKRFRQLVESAPEAILIQVDERLVFVNRFMVSLSGAESAEQLLNHPISEFIHPDNFTVVRERLHRLTKGEIKIFDSEDVFLKLDGSPVYVDVTAVPIRYKNTDGTLVFARDISERKKVEAIKSQMEAQLLQQQKLEAVGTLAGGVAHEINNPLNGIMNYAQLVLDTLDPISQSAEFTREIIHETERISVIVKNLLQFSRQEKQAHSFASVFDIVEQTMSLIRTVIRKDQIALQIDLGEDLPSIKCRSQQIQQVLMNLMTNARDALNEKYPGFHDDKIIRLTGRQYEKDGSGWVRLTVEDHGCGIPKEVRKRMFEPFYSTKPKDIGTGLGLSISFGIVREHQGTLSLETRPGHYTRMHLDLPVDNGWILHPQLAIAEGQ